MGLPDHPHFVPCRFFRTIDDEIVIFSEFIAGDSLHKWIRQNRLTNLGAVLDIAIQLTWALAAAHAQGVIHCDVKPANVLMTPSAVARLTDFGIAKAIQNIRRTEEGAELRARLVHGTLPYESPEQAAGGPLTIGTDVWSWGVTVLEMFVGDRFWPYGPAVRESLDLYMKGVVGKGAGIEIPADVVRVLRRAFENEPTDRWSSMTELAAQLTTIYRNEVGMDYPRPFPRVESAPEHSVVDTNRWSMSGEQWTNPLVFLARALVHAGRDPREASNRLRLPGPSRQSQLLSDMVILTDASQLYEELLAKGRDDLVSEFASVLQAKGVLQESLGDIRGALQTHRQALELFNCAQVRDTGYSTSKANAVYALATITARHGDFKTCADLCETAIEALSESQSCAPPDLWTAVLAVKAHALQHLGRKEEACSVYDRALAYFSGKRAAQPTIGEKRKAAETYANRATLLSEIGRFNEAVRDFDTAIGLLEDLVKRDGQEGAAYLLSATYMNKGTTLKSMSRFSAAVSELDRAIAIREWLVNKKGQSEFSSGLAMAYSNRAILSRAMGDIPGAIAMHGRAISLWETIVHEHGRNEYTDYLAGSLMNKGLAFLDSRKLNEAIQLLDKAVAIREDLVLHWGRSDLVGTLTLAYSNTACAHAAAGELRGAVALHDKAMAIILKVGGGLLTRELLADYARSAVWRASLLCQLGEQSQITDNIGDMIAVLQDAVNRLGRPDLRAALELASQLPRDIVR
jgi:serine/threonine protein kinase